VGRAVGTSRDLRGRRACLEPLKVLVVDDHVDTVHALRLLLRTIGHDVRTATSGAAALDAAREHEPDLALLDLELGDMTGYELARELRAQAGERPLGLIALTGYNVKRACIAAGFDRFVLKPVDISTIDLNMRLARELTREPRR
jgi:CheY-like chemotaxis protein